MFKSRKESQEDILPPSSTDLSKKDDDDDEKVNLSLMRLTLVFVPLVLATFLVALDATIISTAIPTITSEFDSLAQVSWYSSAFLLSTCAFQLPYGRTYTLVDIKWTFLSAIAIFEIGSAVAGASPNSVSLIIGRAIQGLGGSGIFGGAFIIIAETTPLDKRALFTGKLVSRSPDCSSSSPYNRC